ncbi:hypothetical protein OROHE_001755 [Orobanche hederae]
MASTDYLKGVNLRAVKEQIVFSIVVDFESLLQTNFTDDMKLIVRSMKRNGIYNFLNIDPQHLYKEAVIAFYQEAYYVVGYVTNVGRSTQQRTGSKTLDFYLTNQRGQSVRVTLWGSLGDVLIEKKIKSAGLHAVILTSVNAKLYNNKL